MPDTTPARIFLVEDDEHISQVLQFMLERQGYTVELATDGRAAMARIAQGAPVPDLILSDVMLPFHDGFALVRAMRARSDGWQSAPILMLTAKSMEADIVRALDAGANDYVVKPFQPNELLARLRRYLRSTA
ncbi:response regulator transcription factor [Massilia sp. TS11]|uniref:response regulator transcription factor n=1 Tax=Massilia sp. TS11 TaxID=2908003 RepID=UPI001EDB5A3F|nr:response regulator [Massilia sp. TS11]MCG2583963.1 response regulator [Massilia sp. TS11]